MRKYNVDEINLEITNIDFWDKHDYNKGGIRIYWSSSLGFGTLDIVKAKGTDGRIYDEDGPEEELVLVTYSEGMDSQDDKAFTKKLLSLLAGKITIVD